VYGKTEQKVYGNSEQVEAEKYARMPESVLFDDGLSVTARCVYGVLARYVYQGTTVKIGQRRIAKLLGLHVETVNVAIHELEDRQHIAIRGNGKPGACTIWHPSSSARNSGLALRRSSAVPVEGAGSPVYGRLDGVETTGNEA